MFLSIQCHPSALGAYLSTMNICLFYPTFYKTIAAKAIDIVKLTNFIVKKTLLMLWPPFSRLLTADFLYSLTKLDADAMQHLEPGFLCVVGVSTHRYAVNVRTSMEMRI